MSQPQPPAQPYGAPAAPAYGPPPASGQPPGYPATPNQGGYPGAPAAYSGYPGQPAYPGSAAPYPGQPAYPGSAAAYPGQPAYPGSAAPYPGQPAYPSSPAPAGFPGAPGQDYAGPPPAPATPYPMPPAGQMPMVSCRLCGSVPAVDTTFRGHVGMIFLMRFKRFEGPFCRDCGLGTFRHMTSLTLVQGWYSYGSFLITPVTVVLNLARRNKVAHLAPPQPNPFGPSRQPMNPGRHLLARPMTWIGMAIPFVIFAAFIFAAAHSDS